MTDQNPNTVSLFWAYYLNWYIFEIVNCKVILSVLYRSKLTLNFYVERSYCLYVLDRLLVRNTEEKDAMELVEYSENINNLNILDKILCVTHYDLFIELKARKSLNFKRVAELSHKLFMSYYTLKSQI